MAISAASPMNSTNIRDDYMNLLITQLQNQNPLEPMSNDQMASQLAQMSQLEQMEHQTSTFDKVLQAQETTQATAMIGKQITFYPDGADEAATVVVDGVELLDGEVVLLAGEQKVALGEVLSITQGPASE